jgi:hypothetical protein
MSYDAENGCQCGCHTDVPSNVLAKLVDRFYVCCSCGGDDRKRKYQEGLIRDQAPQRWLRWIDKNL